MAASILGNAVRRVEDPDLVRGRGSYVDNLNVAGLLHLTFVRSPLAHARIRGVDVSEAAAAPGVVAVYTADDLKLPRYHPFFAVNERCARPPLATDRVRFVGEAVAAVVASSRAQAADAADLVVVDYDPLPVVVDPEAALAGDAPLQFDELGSNLAAGARSAPGDDPLAGAEVLVRVRLENQRLAVVPLEGNAITVVPGGQEDEHELTVYLSTQMPHLFRSLASHVLGIPPERMRVVAPHVGGGFGGKAGLAAEHSVAVAAARALGRPVGWAETRSENLASMHGRGQVQYVELGLRRDGGIVGMRCRVVADAGAYAGFGGALAMGPGYAMAQGVYRIPRIGWDVAVALTNTTPMGAFRGAGRPETTALLERVIDMAAAELGIDPVEIRRRNFLRPEEFPVTTAVGTTYDSGDYDAALTEALRLADYEGLRAEQARRRAAGSRRALGIGLASYVEITAGGGAQEWGSVTVGTDGGATIAVGTSSHGQGHATTFAMLVADRLGIPLESIRFVQSDTAVVPRGGGTGGSRSLQLGGSAVYAAADVVAERARELAASLLEAAVDDVEVSDGRIGVVGVPDRSFDWAQLAVAAQEAGSPLAAELDLDQGGATYPFGSHVAVVEVDLDTGFVTPLRHIAVDDCGRVLNPLIVGGQQHGGIAQGVAQALWEEFRFDADGNPLTATLADYHVPTAADLPHYEVANTQTPTALNPLGAKGIGEAATIGATPAVQNAVIDALAHLGVRHIDLPCSAQRVWRAVRDAEAGILPDLWREPPAVFAALPVRGAGPDQQAAGADL